MAIVNEILRGEGNKAIPAQANIYQPNNGGFVGIGTVLQTNVETFNQNGGSEGIQGFMHTVDGTESGFIDAIGGIHVCELMRLFCKAIDMGWDPTVSCWSSCQIPPNNVPNTNPARRTRGPGYATFQIQPKGGNGAPWPSVISYELVRIRDWVFTIVEPVPVGSGGGGGDQTPTVFVEQNAGSAESPAQILIRGEWEGGEIITLRVDTDESNPQNISVTVTEAMSSEDIAEAFCDAFNANPLWECETQDGVLYLYPKAPAQAVSVGAAGVVHPQ